MKPKPDPRLEAAARAIDPDAWNGLVLGLDDAPTSPARRRRARDVARKALAAADKVDPLRMVQHERAEPV